MDSYAFLTSLDIPTVEKALQDRETIRTFIKALPDTPPEDVGIENYLLKSHPNMPPRLWTCHGLARGIVQALGAYPTIIQV